MASSTVVTLFEDQTAANRALQALDQDGIDRSNVTLYSRDSGDLSDSDLTRYGVPQDEAETYTRGVRDGGALLVARVDEGEAQRVASLLGQHASSNMASGAGMASGQTGYGTATEGQRLTEVEEELHVGKREVVSGAVRVHKSVETEHVESAVRLREEHADVERRAVDRELSPAEAEAAFREETVEIVERAEVPVVSKEAHVVGEVVVGKDVTEREASVGGEVRRTHVDVEQVQAAGSGSADYGAYDNDFRQHYQSTYGTSGRDYTAYEPAYRYGAESRGRYAGRGYDEVEPDLRRDFEGRHGAGAWEGMKDAVRTGWDRVKDTAHDATH